MGDFERTQHDEDGFDKSSENQYQCHGEAWKERRCSTGGAGEDLQNVGL